MEQCNNSLLHATKIILASLALVLFVAALASLGSFSTDTARAGTGVDKVSGFAWSDNIGWISFNNCSDPNDSATCVGSAYDVNIDATTGTLSGYAWSDAIGWIRFDPDGTASLSPGHGAQVDSWTDSAVTEKPVTGWARACSVLSTADCSGTAMKSDTLRGGWDGWIKMSGTSPDYGVTLDTTTNTFSGFAWGSDVIGWVSFNCANDGSCGTSDYKVVLGASPPLPAVPSVTLTPATQSVASGQSATILWEVKDLSDTTCTATRDGVANAWWNGISPIADDSEAGTVTIPTVTTAATYALDCNGTAASASVNVNPFISSFTATPPTIFNGDSSILAYEVANGSATDECNINEGVGAVSLSSCADSQCSGSHSVTPSTGTDYTITCSHSGTLYASGSRSVSVNVFTPDFILNANPSDIDVTVIGETGGGRSGKAIVQVIPHTSFMASPVDFSVTVDPFLGDPAMPPTTTYSYHFRPVPLTDEDPLPPETVGTGSLVSSRYLNGIEFWIESTGPLPIHSQNVIRITGTAISGATSISRTADITLDTRFFNPEYREF